MLPRRTTVLRDGVPQQIPADDLIVGDVVLLAEGDRISADAAVDSVAGLSVDTSALTGESLPEHPAVDDEVFAGCFVVEGEARAHVMQHRPAHQVGRHRHPHTGATARADAAAIGAGTGVTPHRPRRYRRREQSSSPSPC